jgi:hypothetical protein
MLYQLVIAGAVLATAVAASGPIADLDLTLGGTPHPARAQLLDAHNRVAVATARLSNAEQAEPASWPAAVEAARAAAADLRGETAEVCREVETEVNAADRATVEARNTVMQFQQHPGHGRKHERTTARRLVDLHAKALHDAEERFARARTAKHVCDLIDASLETLQMNARILEDKTARVSDL